MNNHASFIRRSLGILLVALGLGAAVLACEAGVETECFDGACRPAARAAPPPCADDACSEQYVDGDFPPEVFAVMEHSCHKCHQDPHLNGAPIDLLTCDRFHEGDCS